ncbi:MAG: hypothetical protein HYS44_02920 [Candidatus Niyogibacteria bacterium]|nr:hypothetical protein [Candidatus Niyogibacteria bacterium]
MAEKDEKQVSLADFNSFWDVAWSFVATVISVLISMGAGWLAYTFGAGTGCGECGFFVKYGSIWAGFGGYIVSVLAGLAAVAFLFFTLVSLFNWLTK